MPVFTVHEPPQGKRTALDHAGRIKFVRDGFHFWAFLFGPLWLLRNGLWLAFIGYCVVAFGLFAALHVAGVPAGTRFFVGVLFMLLLGFEAASLRRWTLGRRGWTNAGIVVADDREAAERRFFDRWAGQGGRAAVEPPAGTPPPAMRMQGAAGTDVVGLFPQPEARP
jgi:hypothetical protein